MPTQRKVETLADLVDKFSRTQLTLVTEYRGLTVAEITEMRRKLRDTGSEMVVTKNTLARIAAKDTGRAAIEPLLEGPTALIFGYRDILALSKLMQNYTTSTRKSVAVKGVLLGQSLEKATALEDILKMPPREQLIGEVVGSIAAPLANLVGTLNAPLSNLVYTLGGITSSLVYTLQARVEQLKAAEAA